MARSIADGDRLVAETLNSLAVIRQSHGDLGEAETLFREALQIIGRRRGPESPEMATACGIYPLCCWQKGDFGAGHDAQGTR